MLCPIWAHCKKILLWVAEPLRTAEKALVGNPGGLDRRHLEAPARQVGAGAGSADATCSEPQSLAGGIPVEESFAEWRKDPEYVKAYNALEDEFSLAAEMIRARANAGLTQEQLAQRMNTTQAVIARLESGRVKPSTRTLERLAAATGMKLRISFEPGTAR